MNATVDSVARWRAVVVAVTPLLLLVAFLWHPYIPGRLPNDTAVAEAVTADPTRWGLSHLAAGIAFGFAVLAFVAIHGHLRQAGGSGRWSGVGLLLVVISSALYTLLPGMEFVPLAAVESGGDPVAAQEALQPWFVPMLATGGITFFLGTICFAVGIARGAGLGRGTLVLVAGGLIVMGAARLAPLVVVQLYLQGAAALVALWPLAYQMRRAATGHLTRAVPAG